MDAVSRRARTRLWPVPADSTRVSPSYSSRTHEPEALGVYSSWSQRPMKPPMTPPTIGATQKSHSDDRATLPPKIAVAVERAGLTEALETGMATRWMNVRVRPIAIGAKPAAALGDVTLTITTRNRAVSTVSIN